MKQQKLLYTNSRTPTLYFVSLITLVLSFFTFYMIFSDLDEFFEEYSSRASGIGWMILMLIGGNIMLACMLWLHGRYILLIEEIAEDTLLIKTWSIIGLHQTRKYPKEILQTALFHKGVSNHPGAPVVVAPYSVLTLPTGKKLILDEAGGGVASYSP